MVERLMVDIEELARDGRRMIEFLKDSSSMPVDLTFAAELAGQRFEPEVVQAALLQLLRHPSPLVREGAVIGLSHHPETDELREVFRLLSIRDSSPGVRAAAAECLAY